MLCVRCKENETVPGLKYCKQCKKIVLRELRDAGYLTPPPRYPTYRPDSAREDTHATKYGIDR